LRARVGVEPSDEMVGKRSGGCVRIRRGVFPSDALVTGVAPVDIWLDSLSSKTRRAPSLRQRVECDFDVVVSGYPRSGNSFVAAALQRGTAGRLRIGSREHSPLISPIASGAGVPVIIPVREPVGTLASWLVFRASQGSHDRIDAYLASFRDWYRFVHRYRDPRTSVVVAFDDFTRDVNSLFTSKVVQFLDQNGVSPLDDSDVLADLEDAEKEGRGTAFDATASLPVNARAEEKRHARDQLLSDRHSRRLHEAMDAYRALECQTQ